MLQAMLAEFRLDYNQRHFVRNETFKNAAEGIEVRVYLPPCAWGCATSSRLCYQFEA